VETAHILIFRAGFYKTENVPHPSPLGEKGILDNLILGRGCQNEERKKENMKEKGKQ
jgi:hypothetical protein